MPDPKAHLNTIAKIHEAHFGTAEQQRLVRRLAEEKARAAAVMAEEYANLHIPEDQLSFATRCGLGTWFRVAWNGAFMAGYRQALRDAAKMDGGAG